MIGVDAGGTASRAVLATRAGQRLATATSSGVNFRSSAGAPAQILTGLLRQLCAAMPSAIGAQVGVFGIAGAGEAGMEIASHAVRHAWVDAGLAGTPVVVTDIAVAHAAGSVAEQGLLLLAGTGAAAARIDCGVVVRRADGHGWLLGDTGSAVWLGVQATRYTLAVLDGREAVTPLVHAVLNALGAHPADQPLPADGGARAAAAQRVIGSVDRMRPAELGRLAPLVSLAAAAQDPVAVRLTETAVSALIESLTAVADPPDGFSGELVLAGSVLLQPGPVRSGVLRAVHQRWGIEPRDAGDGAGGAAVLALRQCGYRVTAAVHAALVARDRPA